MTTKIQTTQSGYVTLKGVDAFSGDEWDRTYFIPANGGYVRYFTDDGRNPQACEMLDGLGNTLRAYTTDQLLLTIRTEWQSRNRAARKMASADAF